MNFILQTTCLQNTFEASDFKELGQLIENFEHESIPEQQPIQDKQQPIQDEQQQQNITIKILHPPVARKEIKKTDSPQVNNSFDEDEFVSASPPSQSSTPSKRSTPSTPSKSSKSNGSKVTHCPICNKTFTNPKSYKNHKMYAHGTKKFICEKCKRALYNPQALRRHVAVCQTVRFYLFYAIKTVANNIFNLCPTQKFSNHGGAKYYEKKN